ncbi:phosphoribosylglycinamide formyltransferase [Amorphus sp. MBR-141]
MNTGRTPVAVLVSGRGSNMAALIEAAKAPDYPAEIVLVISNRPGAGALDTAAAAGIATSVIDHKAFASKADFEAAVAEAIEASGAQFVCLAGFMRVLSGAFVDRFADRILNIHPSLLPSFKGLDTHERALAEGVRIHGCSVHLVSAELDAGPLVMQAAVPVLDGDTADTLAARVLACEHWIYPAALAALASGAARLVDGRVRYTSAAEPAAPLIWPASG